MTSKILLFLLLLFSISVGKNLFAYGIDSSKYNFTINLGINYHYNFNNRYTPPTYSTGYPANSSGPSGGWTHKYNFDKMFGASLKYNINNKLFIMSNLTFFTVNTQKTSDPDSVIKYVQSLWYQNPPIKIHEITDNVDISFRVGYFNKRLSVCIGPTLIVFKKNKFKESFLFGDERIVSEKWKSFMRYTIKNTTTYFFPSLSIDYCILKKYPISLFFNSYIHEIKDYDFQLGVKFTLVKI